MLLPVGCGAHPSTPKAETPARAVAPEPARSIEVEETPAADAISRILEPTQSEPVTSAMACRPARGAAGDVGELLVEVRVARAHFLHAEADHGGTFTPLKVEATLPEGLEFTGEWSYPPPIIDRAGVAVYRTSVLLKRPVKVTGRTPRRRTISGVVRYQACNDELCWPPGKVDLFAPFSIRAEARP